MPITVPNKASNKRTTAGTSLAITITAPSAGSVLVCGGGGFGNFSSITSGGGGVTTWTSILSFTASGSNDDGDIWYGLVDTTPTTTVTVNFASQTFMAAYVLELVGAQKANENSVPFANDAQAATDSKTITTTTDGDCIISVMSSFTGAPVTPVIPTGYTTAGASQDSASANVAAAYLIQTSHGASTMNWTGMSGATFPSLGAVAILAAGGAAAAANAPRSFAAIPVQAQGRNL